jgi:hypothetical protein
MAASHHRSRDQADLKLIHAVVDVFEHRLCGEQPLPCNATTGVNSMPTEAPGFGIMPASATIRRARVP